MNPKQLTLINRDHALKAPSNAAAIINNGPLGYPGRPRSSLPRAKNTDSPDIKNVRKRKPKHVVELVTSKNASSDPIMFKISNRPDNQEFRISTNTGETLVSFPKQYYQRQSGNLKGIEYKQPATETPYHYRKQTKSLNRRPEFVVTNIQLMEKPKPQTVIAKKGFAESSLIFKNTVAEAGASMLQVDKQLNIPIEVAKPGLQTVIPKGSRALVDKSPVLQAVQVGRIQQQINPVGSTLQRGSTKDEVVTASASELPRPRRSQSPRIVLSRNVAVNANQQVAVRPKNAFASSGAVELGPLASRNLPTQDTQVRYNFGRKNTVAPGQMCVIEVDEKGFGTIQQPEPKKTVEFGQLPPINEEGAKHVHKLDPGVDKNTSSASAASIRPKSRWRGAAGLGSIDRNGENTIQKVVRKKQIPASDRVKQAVTQQPGNSTAPPSYIAYYFKLAPGNNHKLIEKVLINRSWWKKLTSIGKGATVDKPNLYWKMNIDRFDFSMIKENTSGYLNKHSVNRFPGGLQLSDKDFMFRYLYAHAVQNQSLDQLFHHLPLTFSFRMDESEYEQDLQSFCRLFLAVKSNVHPDQIQPLPQDPTGSGSFPIYYEFPTPVNKGWGERARASSMPPRSPDSKPAKAGDSKETPPPKLPPLPSFKKSLPRAFKNIEPENITPTAEFFGRPFVSAFSPLTSQLSALSPPKSHNMRPGYLEQSKNMWIIKPSECDRGKGVEIFSSLEQLAQILHMYATGYNMSEFKNLVYSDLDDGSPALLGREANMSLATSAAIPDANAANGGLGLSPRAKNNTKQEPKKKVALRRPKVGTFPRFVIQKYMEYPALWRGHKFDIRAHALLTQDNKLYVFRDSYIRVCSLKYTLDKQNYFAHLCNTSVNMLSESYGQVAVGNTIGIKDLCQEFEAVEYDSPIGREIKSKHNSFEEYLFKEICRLVKMAFDAVMVNGNSLLNPQGTPNLFELFGFDIMLTADYKASLIEANFIPGLTDEDNEYLKKYLDRMMDDMFKLTIDQIFPAPKQAKRNVEFYPVADADTGENMWVEVAVYPASAV